MDICVHVSLQNKKIVKDHSPLSHLDDDYGVKRCEKAYLNS